jgi:hypothetical protein
VLNDRTQPVNQVKFERVIAEVSSLIRRARVDPRGSPSIEAVGRSAERAAHRTF